MSNAFIGFGTIFGIGDGGGPEVFDAVAEVVSITPPAYTMDTVDVTHMLSTERFREFVPGLRDGGEFSMSINYIPGDATSDALIAKALVDTVGNYKITWPNSEEWIFAGVFVGFAPGDVSVDGKVSATVRIKVSGKPEWFV